MTNKALLSCLLVLAAPVAAPLGVSGARADDLALIKSAESAAPAAVSSGAAILAVQPDGTMRTVREGRNGWWCMADSPATPGPDPMCGDANAMEWAMAWMSKTTPPAGKIGFIYMLAGGTDASNTDPYASAPADGNSWIKTGAHVMVLNAVDMMAGYPKDANPDTTKPYVMWPGTPYAHLMIPIN